ncbi:MAG TPA: L,D-transpeptidase [Longimicrobium sp.]|jgi:lipoprotein-anchoring transpeptidase ErfK/SrfK
MKAKLVRWAAAAAVVSAMAVPALATAGDTPPAALDFAITIDLSDRKLYVMDGEEVVESYSVAVGKPQHPTPRGNFATRRIVWNPRWVPPNERWARDKAPRAPGDPRNPMGRVKIFFSDPDYYIHGTRDVDSLGEAESHGCVRMRNSEVIALAKMVMEHGGARRDPGWFRRVLNRVTRTQEVRLSNAVPVRVRA